MTATRVHAHPTFSQDFWSVLFSPEVLDLTEDESKVLMHAFVMSETEIPSVVDHASVAQ
jgi:hypothetical protein